MGKRKYERLKEYNQHQERISKINDPQFSALQKRLFNYLGWATHRWCSGGSYSQAYIDGLSTAIRIVEYEFVEGIETDEDKLKKRLDSEDKDELIGAIKEIGQLCRAVEKETTRARRVKEKIIEDLKLTPDQFKILEYHALDEISKSLKEDVKE